MKPPAVLICFCCVVLGQEKAVPKSRYEEDIYVNNHTVRWLPEPLSTSYKLGQRFVKVAAVSLMFCLQTHVIRLLTRHEQSVLARDLFVCLRSANQNQWKKTWQFMWSRWSYQHPALLFTTWNVLLIGGWRVITRFSARVNRPLPWVSFVCKEITSVSRWPWLLRDFMLCRVVSCHVMSLYVMFFPFCRGG